MRARSRYTSITVTAASVMAGLIVNQVGFDIDGVALRSAAAVVVAPAAAQTNFSHKTEETAIELNPGQAVEAKVGMRKGTRVDYTWSTAGGSVFFDKHGEREEGEKSYAWGRNATGGSGVLEAAFDGSHGWLWRNDGKTPVRITVRTTGEFNFLLTSPAIKR